MQTPQLNHRQQADQRQHERQRAAAGSTYACTRPVGIASISVNSSSPAGTGIFAGRGSLRFGRSGGSASGQAVSIAWRPSSWDGASARVPAPAASAHRFSTAFASSHQASALSGSARTIGTRIRTASCCASLADQAVGFLQRFAGHGAPPSSRPALSIREF